MAITSEMQTQVTQLYVALFARAPESQGLGYWVNQLGDGASLDEVANAMFDSAPSRDTGYDTASGHVAPLYPRWMTNEQIVDSFYQNVLGRGAENDAEGRAYWTAKMNEPGVQKGSIILELINAVVDYSGDDPDGLYSQGLFVNRVEVAQAWATRSGSLDGSVEILSSVTDDPASADAAIASIGKAGNTFFLTEGRDAVTGTNGDDVFYGDASQVSGSGHVTNILATGDVLDGGAGYDKLIASVFPEVNNGVLAGIYPRTSNIEEVHIEALEGHNWDVGGLLNWNMVLLDAGRMQGVEQFWTDNSSADLFLNDVRVGDGRITKDITFGMRDVDTSAGLYVAFETNSILNAGTSRVNSQVLVRVADVTTATPGTPLANVDLTVGFSLDGEPIVLDHVQSVDGTYAGLKTAIEDMLADKGLGNLVVSFGASYNAVTVAANTVNLPFTAQEILITDPSGKEFSDVSFDYSSITSVNQEFLVAGNAAAVEPGTLSSLIETNLILDNAGRGSTAGHVHIGGMSNSGAVIQKLNLEVDRSSKIFDVYTGYGMSPNEGGIGDHARVAFEQIEVTSGARKGDLTINKVRDVKNFDATAFAGQNLKIGAELESTAAYVFNTANDANSNDWLSIDVYDNVAAHKNFSLSVNTGGGNDVIDVDLGLMDPAGILHGDHNPLINQKQLANAVINAGDGDNVVRTPGAGDVLIETGSGNDTIYTDNTGGRSWQWDNLLQRWDWTGVEQNEGKAVFVFNTVDGNRGYDNLLGNSDNHNSSLANQKAQTYDAFNLTTKVTFQGLESVYVDVESTGAKTTTAQINQAIIKAINEDPVLNKLIVASVDRGEALVVKSLIDGAMASGDLTVDLIAPVEVVPGETAAQKAIREAQGHKTVTSAELTAAGLTIADISTNTANAWTLYATEFATDVSGNQPATYTQVLDVDAIAASMYVFDPAKSANVIKIGGVEVTIDPADATEAAVAAKIHAEFGAGKTVTIPGWGTFTATSAVAIDKVTFTLTPDSAVPFGEVPPALPISLERGSQPAYLSALDKDVGFNTSGDFTGGHGAVTLQSAVMDFANIKISPTGGTALTLSFDNPTEAGFAPGPVNVNIPQGAGPIQIANLVADALEAQTGGAIPTEATVEGTKVMVRFGALNEDLGNNSNAAASDGGYGPITLTVGTPANVLPGASFPATAAASGAFSAQNNVPLGGTISQSINFAGWEVTQGGDITVLGQAIMLTAGMNDVAVAKAVHDRLAIPGLTLDALVVNGTTVSYTLDGAVYGGPVITQATAQDVVQAGVGGFGPATKAVFTIDLSGLELNSDGGGNDELDITIDGDVFNYIAGGMGENGSDVAAALGADEVFGFQTYDVAYDAVTGILTLTSQVAGLAGNPVSTNVSVVTTDNSTAGAVAPADEDVGGLPTDLGTMGADPVPFPGAAMVTDKLGTIDVHEYEPTLAQNDLDGANSDAESDNWVHSGSGNDVVVLSTGEYSNEVIELQGVFGHNTIVNFDDAAPERINGGDYLDFTSYLKAGMAVTTSSGNATGNQVSTISFESLQGADAGDLAPTAQMGSVTQADLAAALAANYSFVGQNVFLIENDNVTNDFDNFGEYLVVSTNGASVQIVGTLDFGDTIVLHDANLIQG